MAKPFRIDSKNLSRRSILARYNTLDKAYARLQSTYETLKQQGDPRSESVRKKMLEVGQDIRELCRDIGSLEGGDYQTAMVALSAIAFPPDGAHESALAYLRESGVLRRVHQIAEQR